MQIGDGQCTPAIGALFLPISIRATIYNDEYYEKPNDKEVAQANISSHSENTDEAN
jgi:hypothetical protein